MINIDDYKIKKKELKQNNLDIIKFKDKVDDIK
jgi:hypothetical protein